MVIARCGPNNPQDTAKSFATGMLQNMMNHAGLVFDLTCKPPKM